MSVLNSCRLLYIVTEHAVEKEIFRHGVNDRRLAMQRMNESIKRPMSGIGTAHENGLIIMSAEKLASFCSPQSPPLLATPASLLLSLERSIGRPVARRDMSASAARILGRSPEVERVQQVVSQGEDTSMSSFDSELGGHASSAGESAAMRSPIEKSLKK